MDLQNTLRIIGKAVDTLSEGDLVTFDQFHKARMKKMGRVAFGPIRVAVGDSIKIGRSKPRQVLDISKHNITLGPLTKVKRGNNPFYGIKYLFWDEGSEEFYLRSAGAGVNFKDVLYQPSELKVIQGQS